MQTEPLREAGFKRIILDNDKRLLCKWQPLYFTKICVDLFEICELMTFKKSAFPSTDNESKKLSLGFLQVSILVSIFMNKAYSSIVSRIDLMSEVEKNRLNLGRLETSKNSSINS